ncbi:SprT protein [Bisgaardia hudsonensis]|uniref:Protein SprT n=1 Tax=Bisgaardia hudsonensis TaxID=109472 RepID=A0A4R2N2K1_9PAST|nr:SprT family zinc-dependent metalloprotease [Bisgaardia hudsonensis]QLB12555.1 SprT family protein [Bisgaardia hudsonensis]TCP14096.1 SprT protein [Bisgaardia hudsonensis]
MDNGQFRQLKMQVQRKLSACLKQAEIYFNRTFTMPTVSYEIRGVKAGVAYLQKNEIRLNRTLLQENTQSFINEVVPHELAHLLVYQVFGKVQPHGKEWKSIMLNIFGLTPNIYHQFDVINVQGQTFSYSCDCQTHHLTLRRHNKIQQNKAEYFCKKCKKKLKLSTSNSF